MVSASPKAMTVLEYTCSESSFLQKAKETTLSWRDGECYEVTPREWVLQPEDEFPGCQTFTSQQDSNSLNEYMISVNSHNFLSDFLLQQLIGK